MDYGLLVDKILHSSRYVRFVTICNLNGEIVQSKHQPGITNVLTPEESQNSLKQAINSWKSRDKLSGKIGKGQYALVVYEKMKRITMPLGENHLIYLTLDIDGGHNDVIDDVLHLKPSLEKPVIIEKPKPKPKKIKKTEPSPLTNPDYWKTRQEKFDQYEKQYLKRLGFEDLPSKSSEHELTTSQIRSTLPKGWKPPQEKSEEQTPSPEEPKTSQIRSTLPKGWKPTS